MLKGPPNKCNTRSLRRANAPDKSYFRVVDAPLLCWGATRLTCAGLHVRRQSRSSHPTARLYTIAAILLLANRLRQTTQLTCFACSVVVAAILLATNLKRGATDFLRLCVSGRGQKTGRSQTRSKANMSWL